MIATDTLRTAANHAVKLSPKAMVVIDARQLTALLDAVDCSATAMAARELEAKLELTLQTAEANFSDSRPEANAAAAAMIAASAAERLLREAFARLEAL